MKRRVAYVLLIILGILPVGLARAEAGSFLLNGDFAEGEGKIPSGWAISFYPQREGDVYNCIYRSTARAKSGTTSLCIDTQPILGEEVTLVFNGTIAREATQLRGKRLVLSGWVYVEKGTPARPIGMRLRTFGRDEEGRGIFLGDVLELTVFGTPGKWVRFQASGVVPNKEITGMDLHCWISPDIVRVLQYLDDVRVEVHAPTSLELTLFSNAMWRDEEWLPVAVQINQTVPREAKLVFKLLTQKGKSVAEWEKPLGTGILGLRRPKAGLPEGSYILSAEVKDARGKTLLSARAPLQLVKSPWEDAPKRGKTSSSQSISSYPSSEGEKGAPSKERLPPAFQVMGSRPPREMSESIPSKSEPLSPDIDLSPWRSKGYVVFSRHYLEEVSPLGRPRPGEIRPLRIFASPGEYEPATLSIWAPQPQNGIRLAMSDLVGDKGRISANNVEIRLIRNVQGLPIFTERCSQVDIPQGETRTFYLLFYIPPTTPAGFYRGKVGVIPSGGKGSDVEVFLRVLPLNLPAPPKGYGFWWHLDNRWNGYYSKDRESTLGQIRRQFVLLREYGCNMVSFYPMPKMTKTDKGIELDFGIEHWGHCFYSLTDLARIGKETGFISPKVPIQYTGAESLHSHWVSREMGMERYSDAFAEFYKDMCKRIDEWARKQGITLAFACVDEIGNAPERRQEALRFYRLAKEAGVLTSVTDNSMHGGFHLMGQPRFDQIIDMRVYNFVCPEMIEDCRRSGDRLWLYNLGSCGWYGKLDRFVFGFFTERCGAEGYSQWAFQWPGGSKDPYESALNGEFSGYNYALPASDGPLPTLALEAVREGIDDARYLHLLPPNLRASLLSDIQPLSLSIGEYLEGRSPLFFDIRRWQIAQKAYSRQGNERAFKLWVLLPKIGGGYSMPRMGEWILTYILSLVGIVLAQGQMITGSNMPGFAEAFGLQSHQKSSIVEVKEVGVLCGRIEGTNVLWEEETAQFEFEILNKTDTSLQLRGHMETIQYRTEVPVGDWWEPRVHRIRVAGKVPVTVSLPARGTARLTVQPIIPGEFGGYALIFDFGKAGRVFGAALVRVPKPDMGRVFIPTYALDMPWPHEMSEAVFATFYKLGIKGCRLGIGYIPTTDPRFLEQLRTFDEWLDWARKYDVTVMLTIGEGGAPMPLGRGRPHLNEYDEMLETKEDLTWLPEYDADFQKWTQIIVERYGWPKGMVNAVELWNEPWEGLSISGWGADMIRYRELYTRMALGVEAARANAGVRVLMGGACSSSNTRDKLFCDGTDTFLKWLDFVSIHYQPLAADPALVPEWHNRKHPYGPVQVWDTESWIANSEDRVAAVIASMRAQGQQRTAGIYAGNVYESQVLQDQPRRGVVQVWAPAAAVAATQKFIGQRAFREILFKNGLPWIFVFDGLRNADDGTVVVVGDLRGVYDPNSILFRNVLGLHNRAEVKRIREEMKSLPPGDSEKRRQLKEALNRALVLRDARLILPNPEREFVTFDYYGNPLPSKGDKLVIPLDGHGYFLRTTGKPGSFQRLLSALQKALIEGIEPVEIVLEDFEAPLEEHPTLRITLTNVLNRPVAGKLSVDIEGVFFRAEPLEYLFKATRDPRSRDKSKR